MTDLPSVSRRIANPTRSTLGALVLVMMLGAPASAGAEEPATPPDEELTGRVDGERMSWKIPSNQSVRAATYTNVVPGVHRISVNAYRDASHSREGSLSMELLARPDDVRVAEIHYFPFSESHPRFSYTREHGEIELEIDALELGTDTGRLSGRLDAELYYHQSPRTQPIPHRTSRLALEFDIEIVRD